MNISVSGWWIVPQHGVRYLSRNHLSCFGFNSSTFPFSSLGLKRRYTMASMNTFTGVTSPQHEHTNPNGSSVAAKLNSLMQQVHQICQECSRINNVPRIVAVSKTKPVSLILEAYQAGQRHFGENYVQELVDKAKQLPQDIQWHFIGHLQTNKVKRLLTVENLWAVETVDRVPIATALELQCSKLGRSYLNVFLQVNTSNEDTKSGCRPDEVTEVAKYILEKCPHLSLKGLMTIGRPVVSEVSQDFVTLKACRDKVLMECQLEHLELSMGMSNDWKAAMRLGSDNLRIGSYLFGERQKNQ
eukprot:jgi/Galph1/5217/GphlegSOOS_G3820.1